MTTPRFGRNSMFRGKVTGKSVQAHLTPLGWTLFQRQRRAVAKWYRSITGIAQVATEADVVESLLRGEADTRAYFEERKAEMSTEKKDASA